MLTVLVYLLISQLLVLTFVYFSEHEFSLCDMCSKQLKSPFLYLWSIELSEIKTSEEGLLDECGRLMFSVFPVLRSAQSIKENYDYTCIK